LGAVHGPVGAGDELAGGGGVRGVGRKNGSCGGALGSAGTA
jgi:hypothetical protein